ncbi:MAG TPA: CAP domain-containing protein, partial [Nonomuraea sp.]|nr:CAP domain-containing protein [Nonomuraea sp.]
MESSAHPRPRIRIRLVAASLAALVAASVLAMPGPAGATPVAGAAITSAASDAEGAFLTLLNRSRTSAGLPALQLDTGLANTARTWSGTMASKNSLYHDPNLLNIVAALEPRWQSGAENVGFGYQVQQLHDAFMASAGHRANIMSSRFNRVGIGVVYAGTKIWVTARFIQGPALTAAAAPAPTPAGVRTLLTGDFNGDGRDDALAYGPGADADELWFGIVGRLMHQVPVTINGQYQPIAGDFDGDGRTAI